MVMDYFKQISSIPRGSGHNTAISNFFVEFSKEHGLKCVQDEAENVVIFKEATPGLESCPPLILQGHMDMVCEKTNESIHDFTTEGLVLLEKDGYIFANGTTLGADNGIAPAYMMDILTDNELSHPALEMVITTDEEIGMVGALALDTSILKGKYMINLDSEEEGVFTAACAGGITGRTTIPIRREEISGIAIKLDIKGLKGGHSGTDIDKNRVNALKVVARILAYLPCDQFLLKSISGGHKDNVIPNEAHVEFVVQPGDCKAFKNLLKQTCDMVCEENKSVEPQMYVDMMEEELDTHNVIIQGFYSKIFYYLTYVPNGVQVMSGDIEGMVESSCNLGIFNTEKSKVFATVSMRSQKKTYKEYLNKKLEGMAEMMGASYETSGAYPGWDMNSQSKFRELLQNVYEEVLEIRPTVTSIHAGLEGGIFAENIPGIDIVSLGPNMYDIHTVNERMEIASVLRTGEFLKKAITKYALQSRTGEL